MADKSNPGKTNMPALRQFGLAFLIVAVLLGYFFRNAFKPGMTVFSNDGPLGAISCQAADTWASWTGSWLDLNWLGAPGIAAQPSVSNAWGLLAGKVVFSKTYALVSLLFVSMSSWLCFRQFKFTPLACILGAIAVAINTDFVATAGWGVAAQPIAIGFAFLALGALADLNSPHRWARVVLGGFAVGMGVMEAFDIGAIFSLFIAAFVLFQAWVSEDTPRKKILTGVTRLVLVAVCAGLIASAALYTLIRTQVIGVAGMAQDKSAREERWVEATLWSTPKSEIIGFVVAGVFGYRMDTPEGGNYWGQGGRHPLWDEYLAGDRKGPVPPGYAFLRYGGGGAYIGVFVALIILWAVVQSFRKQDSAFTPVQRKLVWFWSGAALFSLLMTLGRHAPFYRFFYDLPFANTIRNPTKFAHVIEWALLIVFGYGAHGLTKRYMDPAVTAVRDLPSQWKAWWGKSSFDKKWFLGSLALLAVCAVGWLIYGSQQSRLESYLTEMLRLETLQQRGNFNPDAAAGAAKATASFSIRHVGYFVLFLAGGIGLIGLALSGCFGGKRARLGGILLGALLVADLGRAVPPWILTYDYKEKLVDAGNNPVIGLLKQKPYEHRVARLPWEVPQLGFFRPAYQEDWLHHVFPYNNIQSLDVVMNPRPPAELIAYETALSVDPDPAKQEATLWRIGRRWQLSNTRYLVGPLGFYEILNTKIDPQKRFKPLIAFEFYQNRAGGPVMTHVVQQPDASRPYFALFEFTGALPRAKLYSTWQVSTNDEATLKALGAQEFDPEKTVLVAEPISSSTATNASAGTVEFVSYLPRRIVLRAKADAQAVLLLNDKHDPNWKVTIDGKPAPLLRCNYIMRGVQLSPGEHTVEFRYTAPYETLYVSLGAILIGFALLGYLEVIRQREVKNDAAPASPAKPAKK